MRDLTDAEIEECARAGFDADPRGTFDASDIEDAREALSNGVACDDPDRETFDVAVLARAAEIRRGSK